MGRCRIKRLGTMTQLEFFQNALANSVEILINTEAHVISHLKWLIEQKRNAIEKMAKGNVFNSDDICKFDDWEQVGIPHNAEIKVVAVDSEFRNYDIVSRLKSADRDWFNNVFSINVIFMRDPEPILKSKAKMTDNEKSILKRMVDYYNLKEYNPSGEKLLRLNRDLKELKHKYNMAFKYQWNYGFNEIIDKDILKYGIRSDNVTITKSRKNEDEDDD